MRNVRHLLVMGICGTGKTTLAARLAERLSRPMIEADDYHAPDAVARMRRGDALTDADRWDWLDRVAASTAVQDGPAVLACSALKAAYRDRLSRALGPLDIVFLHGSRAIVAERMSHRSDHYMPTSLIESQLADLEPPEGEHVLTLSIAAPLDDMTDAAQAFATRSSHRA